MRNNRRKIVMDKAREKANKILLSEMNFKTRRNCDLVLRPIHKAITKQDCKNPENDEPPTD